MANSIESSKSHCVDTISMTFINASVTFKAAQKGRSARVRDKNTKEIH